MDRLTCCCAGTLKDLCRKKYSEQKDSPECTDILLCKLLQLCINGWEMQRAQTRLVLLTWTMCPPAWRPERLKQARGCLTRLRAARRLSRDNSLLLAKETWHPGRWKIGKEAGAICGQLFWWCSTAMASAGIETGFKQLVEKPSTQLPSCKQKEWRDHWNTRKGLG